jgi:DNA repair protein SbcC/Rad50
MPSWPSTSSKPFEKTMKLLSIRLHPFGGTANRTCTLHDGINILEGPNEFGKSTLSSALWHALFTPTHLTPANLRNTMARWYPKPGGDHARVTVHFLAEGQTWSLEKTWGAGSASSLQADGAAAIADPAQVQARLNILLHRNEATWRHVLFTHQAQLAATVEQLRLNSAKVDEVQSLLAGAAAIPGDIPPDKLSAAIESRLNQHFGRWDLATHGPEKGRGIDHPWANGVGPLLDAWYAMERIRRKLAEVIQHEQSVDEINSQIHHVTGEMSADDDFVRTGRGLRDGLGQRSGLEERCQRLAGELRLLKETMVAWPGAAQVIQAKETELSAVTKDLETVETELGIARKRGQAEQLRTAHGLLVRAKDDWQRAAASLAESKPVAPELLAELKRLDKEIDTLRIRIAAQKLTARLESASSRSVTIQRGTGEPEIISLSPSVAWENQADGIFRIEFDELRLCVESGTGDVQALFTNLESARARHAELLLTLGHESLAAAQQAEAAHQKRLAEEATTKGLYRTTLQGRTEEAWAADMAALANLPETRSAEVLEAEKNRLLGRKAALDLEIRQERERIEKWTRDHLDLDSLTDKVLAQTAASNQAKQELAGLPELPEGFTSITAYLELLGQKEKAREQQDLRLKDLKIEQGRLAGAAPAITADELRVDLETRQREFERQQATGQSLLRIRAKLQAVIADRGNEDPLQGLAKAVSNHFRNLTGDRYQEVTLDGTAPARVGGTLTLETTLLSQGTLGSLALATRLALSELYLKGMDGFFLLDDPFTDLDATRRAAAVQSIGAFAENHQVLFFTCHPEHAGQMQSLPRAKRFQIAE